MVLPMFNLVEETTDETVARKKRILSLRRWWMNNFFILLNFQTLIFLLKIFEDVKLNIYIGKFSTQGM